MPTQRPTRRRQRRSSGFSPAELQFLTGEPQTGANKFELHSLEHPRRSADFEKIEALLARAGGVVSAERLELQAKNTQRRKEYRARYPDAA